MSTRLSRQIVEALGPGSGKVRVTRQIVEVLGPGGGTFNRSVVDTLSILHTVSSEAEFARSVEHTLVLSDSGVHQTSFEVSVSDVLAMTQDTDVRGPILVSVSQNLGLVQTLDTRRPFYITVAQHISLGQPFVEHLGVINKNVTDAIVLVQTAGRDIGVSVSQTITLSQTGERTNAVIDTLTLVQTATGGKGGSIDHDLGLIQTVTLAAVLNRSVLQTLTVFQSASYILDRPGSEITSLCEYSPFIGFSTDSEYAAPSPTPPTLGSATLTLTYPFDVPTTTLVLRNPRFGNRDRLSFNRISRETRGGTLIVFADPQWPRTQTLELQISGLRAQQAADLKTFLSASLGQEIGLKDHENRQWRGIILNPNTPIAQPGRQDRIVTLEFMGELV